MSSILRELTEDHKFLLFLCALQQYSSTKIAAIRGQTDRNIRKVRGTMLKKIRKKLFATLTEKMREKQPLTLLEKDFLTDSGLDIERLDIEKDKKQQYTFKQYRLPYILEGLAMKNLFERTSSNWVRYSEYEWKTAKDGTLYLTPTKAAQPSIYDPLGEYERLILDAINIGQMESQGKTAQAIQKSIQQFAVKYGLLGLMTALPTTLGFMDYEAVYLPKNHFIREESMWNILNDRSMIALAMTHDG